MSCRTSWIVVITLGTLLVPGCSGLFTKRAIERFALSMQEQDLDKLKLSTSESFEQKALRQDDSAKGLKMLKLPIGKVEIVSVEDLPDGKRRAKVKIGEKDKTKELEYILSKSKKNGWVVDDIVVSQDSGGGQIVERSVSEQMDLLLTCRELLISWRGSSNAEKLAFCDAKLRSHLEPLPAQWLNQMSKEIAGPGHQSSFKPDARLNGDVAFVVIPHPDGNLYLEMMQENDKWLLHDLAIEPKSKDSTGIRSLMKMVAALDQSAKFLTAYEGGDREALSQVSSASFFKQCLSAADLETVPVPATILKESSYEARQFTDGGDSISRLELLVHDEQQTYMLTLRAEEVAQTETAKKQTEFRVDEVTIFEKGAKDVKRMSSLFLAHAVTQAYMSALVERNVSRLKEISSTNFNERVWNRPEARHFAIMPEPNLEAGEPQILSTNFRGDTSEVTLIQGETPLTLILLQAKGWMVVDDVLMPAFDRPTSLKTNLEALLTVHAFAGAIHTRNLNDLIRFSADGLDRIAWRQLAEVPDLTQQLVKPLLSEVVLLQPQEDFTLIRMSNGEVQAEVKLVREGEKYAVHDVSLTSISVPDQKFELLPTLRHMIAAGKLGPANKKTGQIQPVKGVQAELPKVRKAAFEPVDMVAPDAAPDAAPSVEPEPLPAAATSAATELDPEASPAPSLPTE